MIPFDQLQLLPDDNYYRLSESNIEQWKTRSIRAHGEQIEQDLVAPVIEDEIKIGKRVHHQKVQVSKKVHEEEVEINEPGFREEIVVDRDTQIETTSKFAGERR